MIDKIASRFFVSYVGVVVAVGRVASFDWSRGDTEIAVSNENHRVGVQTAGGAVSSFLGSIIFAYLTPLRSVAK
ncbi:MAG: hypothetical protein RSF93_06105, partial [Mucinivorans sp.]